MKIITSRRKNVLFMGPEMRKKNRFRVSIFGSARIQADDQEYKTVYDLAKSIGEAGFDVVTGGGPGMMQAANQGHNAGDILGIAESIGLIIKLPWENKGNPFLEFYKKFDHFSNRLDTFLKLTDVIIITKGGIGTLLELFYMWQHLQVKHVQFKPIILLGEMWETLIDWMKKFPLKTGMISPEDFDYIYIVKTQQEAMQLVLKFHQQKQMYGEMSKLDPDKKESKKPTQQIKIKPLPVKKIKAVQAVVRRVNTVTNQVPDQTPIVVKSVAKARKNTAKIAVKKSPKKTVTSAKKATGKVKIVKKSAKK